jgi:hypothetical protein
MEIFRKPSSNVTNKGNRAMTKWEDYSFEIWNIDDAIDGVVLNSVIVLAKFNNLSNSWIPIYIDTVSDNNNFNREILAHAKRNGATHIHIATHLDYAGIIKLYDRLILKHKPVINGYQDEINPEVMPMTNEEKIPDELKDTSAKLQILYEYEKHYLELIKSYKEEIKFANTLQEDLRRERSQFFTQTLNDVIQTMKNAEIEKEVSAKWIADLVESYTKSIDLSGDLAKTHVIEVFGLLKNEAKSQASKASLDKVDQK